MHRITDNVARSKIQFGLPDDFVDRIIQCSEAFIMRCAVHSGEVQATRHRVQFRGVYGRQRRGHMRLLNRLRVLSKQIPQDEMMVFTSRNKCWTLFSKVCIRQGCCTRGAVATVVTSQGVDCDAVWEGFAVEIQSPHCERRRAPSHQ